MTTIRKGDRVVGLGRNGRDWPSRPTGVVTLVHRTGADDRITYRVQWDGCCVEDDMLPIEVEVAR